MRWLMLFAGLIFIAACSTQDSPMDLDMQAAIVQAAPLPGTWSVTSTCDPEANNYFQCEAGINYYELLITDGQDPVAKGTVVWWGCVMNGNWVARGWCAKGEPGRWKRAARLSVGTDGKSRFTFNFPGYPHTWGFKWKYMAQGSGIKNIEGPEVNFHGYPPT
jgi:hypothetical protein